jgi:hypothetical protein
VKECDDGFEIDKLNSEKDQNGYESSITITWENDCYRWTATKTGISYVRVSVEKNEPRIIKIIENKMKHDQNEEYDDLPF